MISPNIHNIIFDLGGVILNLSIESTLKQLSRMSGMPAERIVDFYASRDEFQHYEKGLIDDRAFRTALRNMFSFEAADSTIDSCWNAMLLDIPASKIELLKSLKGKYRTFLLSNTNSIHVESFSKDLQRSHGMKSLDELFEGVYYSHILKMRKPDPEIYQHVLMENRLKPEETLFLDDNKKNIEGAQSVGIQTYWVRDAEQLYSLFT